MSGERRTPPPDWRHGGSLPEEAPHLRARNLRDDPEVQELLQELSQGLKPGEDPLFYELPDDADDPEACAPNEAKVYVEPTTPPAARHKTIEMARVKVKPEVDPRRAVTQRVQVKRAADPKEDAPPMSGPANAGPKSSAGSKRAVVGVLLLVGVAAAIGIAAAMRRPKTTEAAPSATVTANATAVPSVAPSPSTEASVVPSAAPSTTAAPSTAPSQPIKPPPGRPVGPLEDPYGDAAAAPLPAVMATPTVTAAPSAAPVVTAPPTPSIPAPVRSSSLPSQKPEY